MLELFHVQTLQSKITAYDFYTALDKRTNNTASAFNYVSQKFADISSLSHLHTGPPETVSPHGARVAAFEAAEGDEAYGV